MAMRTSSARVGTPLSTKVLVWLGALLAAVGTGIAIVDHVRSDSATSSTRSDAVPPEASGFIVPGSAHLLQFVGLLVAGVCVVGFLVVARSATRRR
jgi:hypothetical protein